MSLRISTCLKNWKPFNVFKLRTGNSSQSDENRKKRTTERQRSGKSFLSDTYPLKVYQDYHKLRIYFMYYVHTFIHIQENVHLKVVLVFIKKTSLNSKSRFFNTK